MIKESSVGKRIRSYRENLDAHGYKYVYKESDCGHVWKNWRHYLTDFSQYLFK